MPPGTKGRAVARRLLLPLEPKEGAGDSPALGLTLALMLPFGRLLVDEAVRCDGEKEDPCDCI